MSSIELKRRVEGPAWSLTASLAISSVGRRSLLFAPRRLLTGATLPIGAGVLLIGAVFFLIGAGVAPIAVRWLVPIGAGVGLIGAGVGPIILCLVVPIIAGRLTMGGLVAFGTGGSCTFFAGGGGIFDPDAVADWVGISPGCAASADCFAVGLPCFSPKARMAVRCFSTKLTSRVFAFFANAYSWQNWNRKSGVENSSPKRPALWVWKIFDCFWVSELH
jgi:hypothetical protein